MSPLRSHRYVRSASGWPRGLLAGVLLLACAAMVAIPLWIIQPFKVQQPLPLAFALAVLGWAPWATPLLAILLLWVVFRGWRDYGRGGRVAAVIAALLGVACAGIAQINVYERIFHPIKDPKVIQAAESPIKDDEFVLAVRAGGSRRAYPVRQLAYHHLVNDELGGTPLVATY